MSALLLALAVGGTVFNVVYRVGMRLVRGWESLQAQRSLRSEEPE